MPRLPASDSEIKLDIDSNDKPDLITLVAKLKAAGYRLERMWERRSPGGKGWHIGLTVRPRPTSVMEVVALQAILGSDPWRECRTLLRARCYHDTPTFARSWYNVLYLPCPERRRHTSIRRKS